MFVIPRAQLKRCAKLLAAHFADFEVYRLTEPDCVQFSQVVIFGVRRGRSSHLPDTELLAAADWLTRAALGADLPPLTEDVTCAYAVPASKEIVLTNRGLLLDQVEDLLPQSAAYRQAARILIHSTL